ncbi:hypothetical protein DPMN_073071 [Dreissena polymorpha]|uniref:Uncharacterized protein n=1 Tax=Dreissena polymorpha TaxID=45954 RepID=A0A9D4BYD1_DREPO|nr:hypothetical protein DPMN_073071 [Dreissena polymorpha]
MLFIDDVTKINVARNRERVSYEVIDKRRHDDVNKIQGQMRQRCVWDLTCVTGTSFIKRRPGRGSIRKDNPLFPAGEVGRKPAKKRATYAECFRYIAKNCSDLFTSSTALAMSSYRYVSWLMVKLAFTNSDWKGVILLFVIR